MANYSKPHVLFKTIDSVLNVQQIPKFLYWQSQYYQSSYHTLSLRSVFLCWMPCPFFFYKIWTCYAVCITRNCWAVETLIILVSRLEGITGIALKWFRSYFKGRTFSVNCGDSASTRAHLSCGIPQGSILGPLLFSLYLILSFAK